jgi:hypothetical protein
VLLFPEKLPALLPEALGELLSDPMLALGADAVALMLRAGPRLPAGLLLPEALKDALDRAEPEKLALWLKAVALAERLEPALLLGQEALALALVMLLLAAALWLPEALAEPTTEAEIELCRLAVAMLALAETLDCTRVAAEEAVPEEVGRRLELCMAEALSLPVPEEL